MIKTETIERLAGGIAHDLNNQLTTIIGYAELGLMEVEPDNAGKYEFERVIESSEQASNLVDQLVFLCRKQTVSPPLLNLNEVVSATSKMLAHILGTPFNLETDLDPGLWPAIIDRSQLEQIVMNLITNGCDAMPSGGQVLVTTWNTTLNPQQVTDLGIDTSATENKQRSSWAGMHTSKSKQYQSPAQTAENRPVEDFIQAADCVVLSVSDSGPGIDEETRRHIFEPYNSNSCENRGRGLGLSSIYGAIVENEGAIFVTESELGGARFDVYLRRGRADSDEGSALGTPIVT